MNPINDLPASGYSQQAAAIASALVQHPSAASHRLMLWLALDALEDPVRDHEEGFDKAQMIALLLTDLARAA
ncbi:hypothetical protein BW41_00625 [Sphingomonas sp. RIT328]|nr:hypothetical protein BW41_00625 [Sphingomonas sp. RIT328]